MHTLRMPRAIKSVRLAATDRGESRANFRYKMLLLSLFSLAYCFFYILPNFYPLFQPRQLPLTMFDRAVPFLPWTFVVYLSEFVLVAVTILLVNDWDQFNSFARHAFFTLLFIGTIFFLFPTIYPRPVYPDGINTVVAWAMAIIKTGDAPTNCFPSMHVAITSIAVHALRQAVPFRRVFFALWGTVIIVSTLTTKQHYFIDIAGGFVVASLVIGLDRMIVSQKLTRRNLDAVSAT